MNGWDKVYKKMVAEGWIIQKRRGINKSWTTFCSKCGAHNNVWRKL